MLDLIRRGWRRRIIHRTRPPRTTIAATHSPTVPVPGCGGRGGGLPTILTGGAVCYACFWIGFAAEVAPTCRTLLGRGNRSKEQHAGKYDQNVTHCESPSAD